MSTLKDIKKNRVTFSVDGKEYNVRYTMNSFAEMEEKHGTIEAAMNVMDEGKFGPILDFLVLGMQADHPGITKQEVGDLFDMGSVATITEIITEAMSGALPSSEPVSQDTQESQESPN